MTYKRAAHLSSADAGPVEELIGKPSEIRPVHAQELRDLGQHATLSYCALHAIYQIPTIELLEWLDAEIPDKKTALEIGAGHGDLGRIQAELDKQSSVAAAAKGDDRCKTANT